MVFAIQLISLVVLPFTVFLFRNLPKNTYAFNKTLSLLIVGYSCWLLSMLGFGAINFSTILLCLLLTGLVSLWISGWIDVPLSLRLLRFEWRNILLHEIFWFMISTSDWVK